MWKGILILLGWESVLSTRTLESLDEHRHRQLIRAIVRCSALAVFLLRFAEIPGEELERWQVGSRTSLPVPFWFLGYPPAGYKKMCQCLF